MTTDWRFPFGRPLRPITDTPQLLRLPDHELTTIERGLLIEALIHRNAAQCAEALAFHGYCTDVITAMGERPTIEVISLAKLRILDRYVHVIGALPPSHYIHLYGYSYPFHPCVAEVFQTAHEHLANLAATARSRTDFEGLLLGFEEPKR